MAYTKRYGGGFVDSPSTASPIDSQFLNAVEAALLKLFAVDPSAGDTLLYDPTDARYEPGKVADANVAAGAAIAKSKLGALAIVDADVAAGAAIAKSKLGPLAIVDADVSSISAGKITGLDAGGGVPAGVVAAYIANTPPAGWLLCDGAAVSRSTYAALFSVIGTGYGVGDGSSTFNLPDLRGRVPVGRGAHANVVGLNGSDGLPEANRTPLHAHNVPDHTHAIPGYSDVFDLGNEPRENYLYPQDTAGSGVLATDTNGPAYLVLQYIVKT